MTSSAPSRHEEAGPAVERPPVPPGHLARVDEQVMKWARAT